MNCKPQNRLDFIEAKMRDWADIARNTNDKCVRERAQRNLTNLIQRYPQFAEELGLSDSDCRMSGR